MSIDPSIPETRNFLNLTMKIQGEGKMTMMETSSFPLLLFNTLWPSDAIWQQRSWSTLAQVMACCLHQAITWTNVDLSSVRSSGIHLRAISLEIPQPPFIKVSLKITYLKLNWNLPGTNELAQTAITPLIGGILSLIFSILFIASCCANNKHIKTRGRYLGHILRKEIQIHCIHYVTKGFPSGLYLYLIAQSNHAWLRDAVLSKVENPGSPNGPSTVDHWVVRVTFRWSIYDVVRNDNETTVSQCVINFQPVAKKREIDISIIRLWVAFGDRAAGRPSFDSTGDVNLRAPLILVLVPNSQFP